MLMESEEKIKKGGEGFENSGETEIANVEDVRKT